MPTTPNTTEATLMTMDELAALTATHSPIEIQEEQIRRAIAAGNRTLATKILELTRGWPAMNPDDTERLHHMILDSYDSDVAEAA